MYYDDMLRVVRDILCVVVLVLDMFAVLQRFWHGICDPVDDYLCWLHTMAMLMWSV